MKIKIGKIYMSSVEDRTKSRIRQLEIGLKGESNRAAVIIISAHVDSLLEEIIKSYMIPSPNATDALFDGQNSVFANFSNKIDISYRLGLISAPLCRSLHIVRKIRNEFAHDMMGKSLDSPEIKSRIGELLKLSTIDAIMPGVAAAAEEKHKGGAFVLILLGLIAILESIYTNTSHKSPAGPEFLFKNLD
jgi:hypothetical protein